MSLLKHLSDDDVISDFTNNINDFCESYHLESGKPKSMVCTIMIDKFKGRVEGGKSEDWMRKRIDSKYKMLHRINNVNQKKFSKIDKLKAKFKLAESELLKATHEVTIKASKDF